MSPDSLFLAFGLLGGLYFVVKAIRTHESYAWAGAAFFLSAAIAGAIREMEGPTALRWLLDLTTITAGFAFAFLARRTVRKRAR